MLEAYRKNFSLQSNFFRENAAYIAMAASLGFLTTRVYGDVFSCEWRPTAKGLRWLEKTFKGADLEPYDDTITPTDKPEGIQWPKL
jgi:hypothetical protein